MRQDDKKAMAQHVAVLRAGPKAGAEPPRAGTTKSTYHAPPTQEGWLAWATPNGSTRRYYRLVGSYLVRYADEEAARGASLGARATADKSRTPLHAACQLFLKKSSRHKTSFWYNSCNF